MKGGRTEFPDSGKINTFDRMMGSKKSVFSWKDIKSWKWFLESHIPEGVIQQLVKDLKKKENHFEYYDDFSDLKSIVDKHYEYDGVIEDFIESFHESFPFTQMFHSGRPENPDSYTRHGILPLDVKSKREWFRKRFLGNPKYPGITEDILIKAEAQDQREARDGLVYLALDDRIIERQMYHYMLFGSEYIQGLATRVQEIVGYSLKMDLKNIGVATMVEVRTPSRYITKKDLESLAPDVFQNWAVFFQGRKSVYLKDFAIELEEPVPPEWVTSYRTIDKISDEFNMLDK